MHRRVLLALVSAALLAGLAACGDDDDAADETVRTGAVGAPSESTVRQTTIVETTDTQETALVETTIVGTAAPGTAPSVAELLPLNADGLGIVAFGDEPEAAIAAVTELLGAPADDTGWSDPLSISTCPGTEVRRVTWGGALSLFFGDESTVATATQHLFAYSYGTVEDLEAAPVGLATPEGIGLGSTVAYLRAAYPDVVIEPGEDGVIEPNFFVDDGLSGRLTGGADDDLVTVIIGGDPCGV